MSNKTRAITDTNAKLMINKRLAKAWLDVGDYNKLMEIVSILKVCDVTYKETLASVHNIFMYLVAVFDDGSQHMVKAFSGTVTYDEMYNQLQQELSSRYESDSKYTVYRWIGDNSEGEWVVHDRNY